MVILTIDFSFILLYNNNVIKRDYEKMKGGFNMINEVGKTWGEEMEERRIEAYESMKRRCAHEILYLLVHAEKPMTSAQIHEKMNNFPAGAVAYGIEYHIKNGTFEYRMVNNEKCIVWVDPMEKRKKFHKRG